MIKTAIFDATKKYRYELIRIWDLQKPLCGFCMCNPSTADGSTDDPTVKRCISLALRENCGGIIVVNLFAYRSTDPIYLYKLVDPVGPKNNEYIYTAQMKCELFICAWGVHGALNDRGRIVKNNLLTNGKIYHLGQTQFGQPKHPLYLKKDTNLIEF